MLLLSLLLMGPAFLALALGMARHHEAAFGRPPGARRQRALRGSALLLLLVGLAASRWQAAPAQALVDLVAAASVAALAVAALCTWAWPGRR
jgi:hypothetical protein